MHAEIAAFRQGLAETGYVEGRNVAAEYRWADGDNDRLPNLAGDLVRQQPTVIAVLGNTPAAIAVKTATQTIPVVYVVGTDPVQVGLAASLARPGGNLTGVTNINVELLAKNLSVMRELLPATPTIAVLLNPANAVQFEIEMRDVQVAARALGVRVVIVHASRPSELGPAFARLAEEHIGALVVGGENFFLTQRDLIVALAARHAVATIYPYTAFLGAFLARRRGHWRHG